MEMLTAAPPSRVTPISPRASLFKETKGVEILQSGSLGERPQPPVQVGVT